MSTIYTVGVKIDGSAAGLARAAKEALAHTKMMGAGMGQEFSKMAKAREMLGVRPEREIQREIYRTEAAYNRLARSGTLSFNDQRRAAAAMRTEVGRLSNEMGKLTTQQKLARGFVIGGGVIAAGAMVAPTVRKTMAYDERIAYLANTGFSKRDAAGRRAGKAELDDQMQDAVKYGGGTRDSAVGAAETLYGAGIFDPAQTKTILREAVKAGRANDADPSSFAELAIKANKSMGIAPDQMSRLFGIGTFAGQSGGFEIKDMAKHLPAQMGSANQVGMYGEAGFAKLAALNQAAVTTAGTKDEAGNNVRNLMAKLGSPDTRKDFQKMGIDLPKMLAEGRMKGLDALDVVGNVLEGQLAKDKNFQRVQKELNNAKDDKERSEKLTAVGNIAQGTIVSKVFQDQQALMALVGFLNDRKRVNQIAADSPANVGASDLNHLSISETASYKIEAAAMARDMAFQKTMDKMMPAIGGVADGLTDLMTKYPGYTTAIVAAATAVTGLAGAAGLAALAMRGGAALPGGMGPATGPGAAVSASKFLRFMGTIGKLAGPASILFALEGISDEDIARVRAADAKKARNGGGSGIRGQGFNDPRIIGSESSAAALEQSLRATEVKGEIFVRVSAAPGLNVQTELTSSSPRIPMKASLGQTNMLAGN